MGRLLDPSTCLPHKNGNILLNVLFKDTKSNLAGFSAYYLLRAERQAGKLQIIIKALFNKKIEPRSTDCEPERSTTATVPVIRDKNHIMLVE